MSAFRKILSNALVLASGSVGASAIGLVSFALIARTLSLELFGVLTLAQAYSTIIDRLINFQSWQALIKYGSDVLERRDTALLKRLFHFGFALDFITALLACVVGILLPYLIGDWLGWGDQKTEIASVFCIVILFNIEGTPTAVLRLFDKFKNFAYKDFLTAILKLFLVGVGFINNYGIWWFVGVTMLSQVVGYLYLLISSLRLLKRHNIQVFDGLRNIRFRSIGKDFQGIWGFVWDSNIHSSVRMVTLRLDSLIVDSLLGSAATGLYQVTKQFSKVFSQVSQPLYKSIYPELTKLWSKGEVGSFKYTIKRFMFLGAIFAMVAWLVFLFSGTYVIELSVGKDYLRSYEVTVWYMLGVVITVIAFPITPAVLAMGESKLSLRVQYLATIVYCIAIYPLISHFGLNGAGIAYFLLYVSWSIIMTIFYNVRLKQNLLSNV